MASDSFGNRITDLNCLPIWRVFSRKDDVTGWEQMLKVWVIAISVLVVMASVTDADAARKRSRAHKRAVAAVAVRAVPTVEQMPPILAGDANPVPACVTPANLMQFAGQKNSNVDQAYTDVAAEYKKHGEALGVRWDYAFFQMLDESAYLKQITGNNFGHLGAISTSERGQAFADVSSGVLGHLQHIKMYSGERIENPVAERTKMVQDELLPWAKAIRLSRPVTFIDLAKRWSPSSHYANDVEAVAKAYRDGFCGEPVVASAEPQSDAASADAASADAATSDASGVDGGDAPADKDVAAAEPAAPTKVAAKSSGKSSKKVLEMVSAPAADGTPKAGLSATQAKIDAELARLESNGKVKAIAPSAVSQKDKKAAKIAVKAKTESAAPALDAVIPAEETVEVTGSDATESVGQGSVGNGNGAAGVEKVAAVVAPLVKPAAASGCKVYTASYGGEKSLLIKAEDKGLVTYTALSVHDGKEDIQAKAYIDAYAKGGAKMGSFGSQKDALSKAFELCPEG